MDERQRASAAMERWVVALNHPQDKAALLRAAAPDVHARRHGNDVSRGRVLEWFDGQDRLGLWFKRSPAGLVFSLAGQVEADPGVSEDIAALQAKGEVVRWPSEGTGLEEGRPAWRVRYRLNIDDFEGGGWWRFNVIEGDASEGVRVHWLEHIPDELHERYTTLG